MKSRNSLHNYYTTNKQIKINPEQRNRLTNKNISKPLLITHITNRNDHTLSTILSSRNEEEEETKFKSKPRILFQKLMKVLSPPLRHPLRTKTTNLLNQSAIRYQSAHESNLRISYSHTKSDMDLIEAQRRKGKKKSVKRNMRIGGSSTVLLSKRMQRRQLFPPI